MSFKDENYIYQGPFGVAEVAKKIGCEVVANGADISSVNMQALAPLGVAGDGDLTFFDNPKYMEQFLQCSASVCIIHPKYVSRAPAGVVLLTSEEAYTAYAKAAQMFYASKDLEGGISPHADVHPSAKIGKGCSIGAFTSIAENVVIGDNTEIGKNVTIRSAHIGSGCVVNNGVRIGQEGFGFAMGRGGHVKVPQLGGVVIGDFVEIGANSCVDRGAGPNTVIGNGTKIDNLVQIAHNVEIGEHCVIAGQTGVAGSTKIGDYAVLGGQAAIAGHLRIGAAAKVAGGAGVVKDIPPHTAVGGYPAVNIRDWHKASLMIEKMIKNKKPKE